MRFSSVFLIPLPQRLAAQAPAPAVAEPARPAAPAAAAPACELPEDLDQRVRLVGEWQLGLAD